MKTFWHISFAAAALIFLGCKSDNDLLPFEGGPNGLFSLSISVTDTLYHPVSGLRISLMTGLAGVQSPSLSAAGPLQHPLAATNVGFDLAAPARVTFTVMDLDNNPVASLADRTMQNPGSYLFTLHVQQNLPTRVFKCRLIARDTTTGAVLFADSNYAVLWQRDVSLAVIGSTSAGGTFTTRDSLLFPNVLTLPSLVLTSAAGPTPLGDFSVRDTVTFILTDTVSQRSQSYQRIVFNAGNVISLLWTPSAPSSMANRGEMSNIAVSSLVRPRRGVTWRLWQNYPNPFD